MNGARDVPAAAPPNATASSLRSERTRRTRMLQTGTSRAPFIAKLKFVSLENRTQTSPLPHVLPFAFRMLRGKRHPATQKEKSTCASVIAPKLQRRRIIAPKLERR